MPIQIIPKPEERKAVLPEILFYFSLILFVLAVAGYFVLDNLIQKTQANIQAIDGEISQLSASPEGSLEAKILTYQKKINDFSMLLKDYRYSSQLFPLIERLAHPQVVFSNFQADIEKNAVNISGSAGSFQSVAQQLFIFRKEPLIKEVKLFGVSFGEAGKIPFSFEITLDSSIFTKESLQENQSNE